MAGGVAGVAWLGDLALAGAAAAGGHDGDGFGGFLGIGREGGLVVSFFRVERWVPPCVFFFFF